MIKGKLPKDAITYAGSIDILLKIGKSTRVNFHIREYEDGTPGEFYLQGNKLGSEDQGSYEDFAKDVSRQMQREDFSLEKFVKNAKGIKGNLAGRTNHPDIPECTSIQDLLAKLIEVKYLSRVNK